MPNSFSSTSATDCAHEIDDLLRRVDDAHRVGQLDRVALEEPLVDRVEEVLLVGPVGHRAGGVLDGDVEAVEVSQERVAVEAVAGQGLHHLFDLGGDDVAADELGVVENLADQPLGQDVLDEHFIDGGLRRCSG